MPDDAVMKITTRREQGKMFTSGQRIPLVHRRQQIRSSGDAPMFLFNLWDTGSLPLALGVQLSWS
jgi:hypothetical protein